MMTTMRATMLVMPSDESDLPLFDDVKKGESYLLRDTFDVLFDVLDLYFVTGHVFGVDFYLFMLSTCLCYFLL